MNQMMEIVSGFDGRKLPIRHIPGPEGVRGRNSDNALILEKLGWEPTVRLADGLHITYGWIKGELAKVCPAPHSRLCLQGAVQPGGLMHPPEPSSRQYRCCESFRTDC